MYLLGISAFYHDSAACLLTDGTIVCAAQEERFTRVKNDASFPASAIQFCLDYAEIGFSDLTAIVYYEKPFLKFERILETQFAFAPYGFKSFSRSIPLWVKDKLFLKQKLAQLFSQFGNDDIDFNEKILFSDHHLSHAASAFYPSL